MPKERINEGSTHEVELKDEGSISEKPLFIRWNKIGWVQLIIEAVPWIESKDSTTVDLRPKDIDKLIKVLKKAKRQAYAEGNRHYGFWDNATERLTDEIRSAELSDIDKTVLKRIIDSESGIRLPKE